MINPKRLIARAIILTMMLLTSTACLAKSADSYPALRNRVDQGMQAKMEWVLDQLGLTNAARNKKIGLALVDITNPKNPRTASVNGDKMFYAASLPKVAILLGAFVQIEQGRMNLDANTRHTLTKMIRVSSNQAASEMLLRVGQQRVADILRSPKFKLYDPKFNGGLWCGKPYGKAAAWRRDPLHNISHGATALQVAKFYYMLETNRLVNPGLTRQMKQIMSHTGIPHKFVRGLRRFYPNATIYRKSGSWRHFHSDSALIQDQGRTYIVVGLTEHKEGGKWLEMLSTPMHDIVMPKVAKARIAASETKRDRRRNQHDQYNIPRAIRKDVKYRTF